MTPKEFIKANDPEQFRKGLEYSCYSHRAIMEFLNRCVRNGKGENKPSSLELYNYLLESHILEIVVVEE